MAWYREWFGTRYYSLLYGHRDEQEARAWVDLLLGHWDLLPGARVLDMACGRGRHVQWFVRRGLRVTGIDLDPASIEEARTLVPEADLRVHDMRQRLESDHYDAACCLFTSLGYSEDRADDQRVFQAAFQALRPGGRFVLDFMNTPRVVEALVPVELIEREGVRFTIQRMLADGAIIKRIEVEDGAYQGRFEERVAAWTPAELDAMALAAGFQIDDRTDGPEAAPFDPVSSSRYVLWMRRPA